MSRRYAPYAVVEGDSGVAARSASLMPHCAQNALCVATSLITLTIVCVADSIELYVEDFATKSLHGPTVSMQGIERVAGSAYPYARA